ncbi:branched-chain amino acid ABC transporter permease [Robbsia sp. KACC 23696]|uniref:branched-chain amino acid ABC transporter permease n=1 Tax=Robbsia sp. KACC 23696 TaxID=3149231 RepID=UPI00325C103C
MAQLLFNGFIAGLLIALPALALSLVYSVMRFANFAIGALLTFSAYGVYYFNVALSWPLGLSVLAGAIVCIVASLIVNALVHAPLRRQSALTQLVASMGVAFILENIVRVAAGNDPRSYDLEIARPVRLWGIRVNQEQGIILLSVVLAATVTFLLLRVSRLGRAMRALADDPDLAAARGISISTTTALVWVMSAILATIGSTLIGIDSTLTPEMGAVYVLPIFSAAILGGIARPFAALVGAIGLGICEQLSTLFIQPYYQTVVAYVIMTLLLLLRPSGLFGMRSVQR